MTTHTGPASQGQGPTPAADGGTTPPAQRHALRGVVAVITALGGLTGLAALVSAFLPNDSGDSPSTTVASSSATPAASPAPCRRSGSPTRRLPPRSNCTRSSTGWPTYRRATRCG
ncbi:hypothetical protein ACRAWF_45355 [Streptomyces sp. L7]